MLGGLARSDQKAAGELYVRGLLTGGRRKPMQPMAERLGVDHQRLQQFITSSTWDDAMVRRNVARRSARATSCPGRWRWMTPGSPRTGRRCCAWPGQYSGTLGKVAKREVGGCSVHLVSERASRAADWAELFCPGQLGMAPR